MGRDHIWIDRFDPGIVRKLQRRIVTPVLIDRSDVGIDIENDLFSRYDIKWPPKRSHLGIQGGSIDACCVVTTTFVDTDRSNPFLLVTNPVFPLRAARIDRDVGFYWLGSCVGSFKGFVFISEVTETMSNLVQGNFVSGRIAPGEGCITAAGTAVSVGVHRGKSHIDVGPRRQMAVNDDVGGNLFNS